MARGQKLLTAKAVGSAKTPGRYSDGGGLYLEIGTSGTKRWLLRIQTNGRRRDFGLGSQRQVSLAEARIKADEFRRCIARGGDPALDRRQSKIFGGQIPTFEEAARVFHAENLPTWRNAKHGAQVISTLATYAFPQIGNILVSDVTEAQARAVLMIIWLEKPETAKRLRQRISAVIDWARANGYRDTTLDLRTQSLALPRQNKAVQHFRAMPYNQVATFVAALQKLQTTSVTMRLALEFTILTAARIGEVRGAVWSEIDLNVQLWTIPAERMKAAREHRVPLSQRATDILQLMAQRKSNHSDLVFPGSKPGQPISNMALTMFYRRLKVDVTTHGFRSTFRDWCSEKTEFPREIAEAALAHQVGSKIERAYARSDLLNRRRDLMDAWAAYCGGSK
jgi:integrase